MTNEIRNYLETNAADLNALYPIAKKAYETGDFSELISQLLINLGVNSVKHPAIVDQRFVEYTRNWLKGYLTGDSFAMISSGSLWSALVDLDQKEGESGRRKINQITRWLTIAICLVQAPGYLASLTTLGVPPDAFLLGQGGLFYFSSVIILVTGCIFAMWLGERITDKGIGNGISLLIMVGIIATLPQSFIQNALSRLSGTGGGGLMMILIELVIWFVIILASIMLVMAVRKVAVQYARRTATGGFEKNVFGSRQFLPLKLNASGVMPIIFAQAIMFVPSLIGGTDMLKDTGVGAWLQTQFSDMFGLTYNIVFGLLIIIFTYFYTAITVPTNKMADDLKRSGGFIPGIRPGTETAEYLDKIMSQITLPGSIFLAIIAVFPAIIVKIVDVQAGWALFFGGTSLLIMVGVAIDTMQQINAYLLNKHYDGLMKSGKNRKAIA